MPTPVLHILVSRVILTHVVAQLSSLDLFATNFAGDEGVLLLDVLGQQLWVAVNGTALRAGDSFVHGASLQVGLVTGLAHAPSTLQTNRFARKIISFFHSRPKCGLLLLFKARRRLSR